MTDLSQELLRANQHYQQKEFALAEQVCQQILNATPAQGTERATTWQILGMAQQRQGRLQEAIAAYEKAIALNPTDVRNYNNLGTALRALNQPEAAIAAYRKALEHRPDYPEAYSNLGNLLRQQGDLQEAIAAYQKALELDPSLVDALHGLGCIYQQLQQYEQAAQHLQQALRQNPRHPDVLNNLGNTLQRLKRFDAAVECYRRAIAERKTDPAFYNNLGAALQELGQVQASVKAYQYALKLQPTYADAHYNLGNNYKEQDRLEDAVVCYQQAIALRPDYAAAYNNLGLVLFEQNKLEESIEIYQKALALRQDYPDAHLNMGLSLLQAGSLAEGFREYEWRWQVKGPNFKPARPFPQPQWDGSDLEGKTLLLHAEQGFGDTIQFIRYAPLVAQRGGRVVMECQEALVRLLQPLEAIAACVPRGAALPEFQVHAPLMSVPHLLGTTLDTIPAEIPYLTAPSAPENVLPKGKRATVGLVWAGSVGNQNDRRRSLTLRDLWPLLSTEDVLFVSLQKEVRPGDEPVLATAAQAGKLYDGRSHLGDFADTAALLTQLDLVITVDTAVAHLAGALGRPVWILLSFAPDWRWMLDRSDSPWYPTARLFRQIQRGQWGSVVQAAIAALRSHFGLPDTAPEPLPLPVASRSMGQPSGFSEGAASLEAPTKLIGIGWQITPVTGWGIYGLNLSLQLLQAGYAPVPLLPPLQSNQLGFNPLHWALLRPFFSYQQKIAQALQQQPSGPIAGNFLLLRGLGNQFSTASELERVTGRSTVGMIFFEDTRLLPGALEKARGYDLIITGSRWNEAVLRDHGCTQVQTVFQGVDPAIFHPAPAARLFGDRFVIFSGGKLEYRKGQDLVVKAFQIFQTRHPEALLVTAWHNLWPRTMVGLDRAGHVEGLPQVDANGRLQVVDWLVRQGIPAQAVVNVGAIPNHLVGQVIREADVALFPNRAEGGTNLAAMECLACGVPTILSANTGHLDLLGSLADAQSRGDRPGDHAYGLWDQRSVIPIEQFPGTAGWGESSVEEIVACLEQVYVHRSQAQTVGQSGARFMADWTWMRQTQRLLVALSSLL
jgi:tetratricopeptide (TPR) repeat protein/glycosyltransferase involved in cell wall biosynthesis